MATIVFKKPDDKTSKTEFIDLYKFGKSRDKYFKVCLGINIVLFLVIMVLILNK